ncbi:17017_t:CDS:1, partial [Entrophospora sp. SA101]
AWKSESQKYETLIEEMEGMKEVQKGESQKCETLKEEMNRLMNEIAGVKKSIKRRNEDILDERKIANR